MYLSGHIKLLAWKLHIFHKLSLLAMDMQPWSYIVLHAVRRFTYADICCCWTYAGYADSPAIRCHCRHMYTTGTLLWCCCSRSWESWWCLVIERRQKLYYMCNFTNFLRNISQTSIASKALSTQQYWGFGVIPAVDNCRHTKLLFEKHRVRQKEIILPGTFYRAAGNTFLNQVLFKVLLTESPEQKLLMVDHL